jgi:hypothetical protein
MARREIYFVLQTGPNTGVTWLEKNQATKRESEVAVENSCIFLVGMAVNGDG